ncbi:MAG: TIGR02678 family protein [Pseudomonadota bacterium]|nr:TIGR02678 family protein [Pseudomonadota bacterium]
MSATAHVLSDVLERSRQDERRRALRALLMRPLLAPEHPAFSLVRRHADWLRNWLTRETGWVLTVEADFARLQKYPAGLDDGTRGARAGLRPADLAFSRRRYALLCLALATLEKGENQVTLGRLGEAIVAGAAEPELARSGLRFDLTRQEQRRDLVAVVRLLLHLGVLARVAGDEDAYIRQERDVLYDVDRRVLSTLLIARRGPSLLETGPSAPQTLDGRLAAIGEHFAPDTPEARNRLPRQRLTARLLDDPVLYTAELTPDEQAYLTSQRHAIVSRVSEATGLVAEVRAEGLAMVDAQGDLTDEPMPAEGTESHVTLLLADLLARTSAEEGAGVSLTWDQLHTRIREWADSYKGYWKKSARDPGAEEALCRQAARRLKALRLVEITEDGLRPLPAVGRYALSSPRIAGERRSP